eukprot:TRINITY_DN22124_c0_g1_i2.p1 TRINITY_DN22124_c0_g1~~TRINITY_DN22124_c0_g1_i2.p1  ORF type:complete len:1005 (+),score=281.14 TRINITY_DN22124_c0_g1_i2:97-3015(+)
MDDPAMCMHPTSFTWTGSVPAAPLRPRQSEADWLSASHTSAPAVFSRQALDASIAPRGACEALSVVSTPASTGVARDVRALADAQARLVRVIEEVSQELSQRLAGHDAILSELQQGLSESVTGQANFRGEFQRSQAEEAARQGSFNSEILRLRSADNEMAARLAQLEAKHAAAEEEQGHLRRGQQDGFAEQNARLNELVHQVQQVPQSQLQATQQKLHELRLQLHQELEQQRQEHQQFLLDDQKTKQHVLQLQQDVEKRQQAMSQQLENRLQEQLDKLQATNQQSEQRLLRDLGHQQQQQQQQLEWAQKQQLLQQRQLQELQEKVQQQHLEHKEATAVARQERQEVLPAHQHLLQELRQELKQLKQDDEEQLRHLQARVAAQESATALPKLQQQLEEQLLPQLSQQMSEQLQQNLQQQLHEQLQPQLQQQVQQHLDKHHANVTALFDQVRSDTARSERLIAQQLQEMRGLPDQIQKELTLRFEAHERSVADSQEALKAEAVRREKHLGDLQKAAQRLAKTASERAQASTQSLDVPIGPSGSSSLAARLAQVEVELQGLQGLQQKERERRLQRIHLLEDEISFSPLQSPREGRGQGEGGFHGQALSSPEPRQPCSTSPQSPLQTKDQKEQKEIKDSKIASYVPSTVCNGTAAVQPDLQRLCEELRVQVVAELGESRKDVKQMAARLTSCETELGELRLQVKGLAAEASRSFRGRLELSQGSPPKPIQNAFQAATPDWPLSPALEENGSAEISPPIKDHMDSCATASRLNSFGGAERLGGGSTADARPSELRLAADVDSPARGVTALPPWQKRPTPGLALPAALPAAPARAESEKWSPEPSPIQKRSPDATLPQSFSIRSDAADQTSGWGRALEGPLLPPWAGGERVPASPGSNLVASPSEERLRRAPSLPSYSFGAESANTTIKSLPLDSASAVSSETGSSMRDLSSSGGLAARVQANSRFGVLPPPKVREGW